MFSNAPHGSSLFAAREIQSQFALYLELLKLNLSASQLKKLHNEIEGENENYKNPWFERLDNLQNVPHATLIALQAEKSLVLEKLAAKESTLQSHQDTEFSRLLKKARTATSAAMLYDYTRAYDLTHQKIKEFEVFCTVNQVVLTQELRRLMDLRLRYVQINHASEQAVKEHQEELNKIKHEQDQVLVQQIITMMKQQEKRANAYMQLGDVMDKQEARRASFGIKNLEMVDIYNFFIYPEKNMHVLPALKQYALTQIEIKGIQSLIDGDSAKIKQRKEKAKEVLENVERFNSYDKPVSRESLCRLATEKSSNPALLGEAINFYSQALTQKDSFVRLKKTYEDHMTKVAALHKEDIDPVKQQAILASMQPYYELVSDPVEMSELTPPLADEMKTAYATMTRNLQIALPAMQVRLVQFENEYKQIEHAVTAICDQEKKLTDQEGLTVYCDLLNEKERIERVNFAVPEKSVLNTFRLVMTKDDQKDTPFYREIDALWQRFETSQIAWIKCSHELGVMRNLLRNKFEVAFKKVLIPLEERIKKIMKNACTLGDLVYLTQDSTLRVTDQWIALLKDKQDALEELARLREMQVRFKVSLIPDVLTQSLNLITNEEMPLSETFKKQKDLVHAFTGFNNPLLAHFIVNDKLRMKSDATVLELNAINQATQIKVSDEAFGKSLQAVGLLLSKDDITKINRLNRQIRYRQALENKVLRDYVIDNNIHLRSTSSKLWWTPTLNQIANINDAMINHVSDEKLVELLSNVGITSVPSDVLAAIQKENGIDVEKIALERRKTQEADLALVKKIEENTKLYVDIRAIQAHISRLFGTLATLDFSVQKLQKQSPSEWVSIESRLDEDLKTTNAFIQKLAWGSSEYDDLHAIQEQLFERLNFMRSYIQKNSQLIVSARSNAPQVNATKSYDCYVIDPQTLDEYKDDKGKFFCFQTNYANQISYPLRDDRAMSYYDHQIGEVMAYNLCSVQGQLHKEMPAMANQNEFDIWGPSEQALEMARKMYHYMPVGQRSIVTIYINNAPVSHASLEKDYMATMGRTARKLFKTGRAFVLGIQEAAPQSVVTPYMTHKNS